MAARKNVDLVVVGADGSWQSQKAVAAATREAARNGTNLLVLTIARGEGMPAGLADLRRFEENTMESALATSKRAVMVAESTDRSVPVELAVLQSVDAPALDAVIEHARLLVLGGHGRRGQAAFSIGSTSGDLVRRFRTPVLLPRVEPVTERSAVTRHAEVHVGLSGLRDESDLLRLAAAEAASRGSSLRVIRAAPTSHPGQRMHHEMEETWRAVRSVPECAAVPFHVEVVQEEPVAALLGRCASEDLLVVGTRGGGRLAGLISGSVARGVLDGLVCDVMVVPPGARTGHPAEVTHTGDVLPIT
jgi:nucleotide-binding universal stress UspA family protein